MKQKEYERDVDECVDKIEAILKEYNCEIGVYDGDTTVPTIGIDIDIVDIDTSEYKTLSEQK